MKWNGIGVVQLEGTIKDHLVQLPDHFRANQKLKHAAEDFVQISLDHSQARDMNNLSRKPVLVIDHSYRK